MKKYFATAVFAVTMFFISLVSCTKDVSKTNSDSKAANSTSNVSSSSIYTACGAKFYVFDPNPNLQYSFMYHALNSTIYKPFGIDNIGNLNFNIPDKFIFQPAGYTSTGFIKTWFIKRADGKYLTVDNGIIAYENKQTGAASSQIFLIGSSGKRYRLLNPDFCEMGTIGWDIDEADYRFFADPSNNYTRDDQLGLVNYK